RPPPGGFPPRPPDAAWSCLVADGDYLAGLDDTADPTARQIASRGSAIAVPAAAAPADGEAQQRLRRRLVLAEPQRLVRRDIVLSERRPGIAFTAPASMF